MTLPTTPAALLGDYLDDDALARELRVSPRTLARWRRLGEAPATVRVGRRTLTRRSTAAAWLAARERARAA